MNVMDSREPHAGITKAEMAAREESMLGFPRSRLVQEKGYDEGEGCGFDGMNTSAMYQRRWSALTDSETLRHWYRDQLTARGWERTSGEGRAELPPLMDVFRRGSDVFVLRVFGHASDRPFWMYWPPGEKGDTGLHYDAVLEATSGADTPPG